MRFRTDGNSTGDDWFIDNVYVGEPTAVDPPIITSLSPNSGSTSGGTTVSILGSNFDPGAVVLFGTNPVSVNFISSSELEVVTPPGTGSVVVSVTQGAFSDFIADGYTYLSALLRVEDVSGPPGSTVTVDVLGTHTVVLEAYSFGIDHDGDLMTVLSVTDVGTAAEGASFFAPGLNTAGGVNGGWFTLGVVIDLDDPTGIPPGSDNVLCRVEYEIQSFVPTGLTLPLELEGTLGTPLVPISFLGLNNLDIIPDTLDGSVTTAAGVPFIRGDVNFDGAFNGLTDALFLLNFGFSAGPPPPCEKAADADDDGAISALPDALYILGHQFNGGPAPFAPYPTAGLDPTPDALTCSP